MNSVYLYNGSFDSLLSLIFTLLDKNIIPSDIKSEKEYKLNIIDNFINIDTSNYSYNNILSLRIMYTIFRVYLSNDERKELIIYYFIKNALIYKNKIFNHKNLNCVLHTIRINKYVGNEAHKLKGFLRFKEIKNGFYYGEMAPNNNVIFLISEHFKKRLNNEYFLIKDTKRNIYAFYDKKKITYLNDEDIKELNLEYSGCELEIESLWKDFFKTIGIKERSNYKAQRNFMPKRYWKYIIEMENKL